MAPRGCLWGSIFLPVNGAMAMGGGAGERVVLALPSFWDHLRPRSKITLET